MTNEYDEYSDCDIYSEDYETEEYNTEPDEKELKKEEPTPDEEALSYNDYIAMLHQEFMNKHQGQAGLEKAWNEVRSQINSCLKLGIKRHHIRPLISLDYSYELREVIKFMYFAETDEKVLDKITPATSIKEALSFYDTARVEGTITNMLDTPLNAMSSMIESYKEDLQQFKENVQLKLVETETELAKTKAELESANEQLNSYKETEEREKKKLENEKLIEHETEKRVKERLRQELEKREQLQEQQQLINQINVYAEQLNKNKELQSYPRKKGFFHRKKDAAVPVAPVLRTPTFSIMSDIPLPDDFDLSEYLMKADLSSSQMDVIALASKCDVPDQIIKNMIDSNKDARQLKQILEVFLAKREKEKKNAAMNNANNEEGVLYD